MQSSDRDEINDIPPFYEKLIRKIKAPIMIDTTDPKAIELSLTYCQGKSIINSINLEDGDEKFEGICPLARAYGAALVVGSIDEDPSCRRKRSRASANWQWRSALSTLPYNVRIPQPRTSLSIRSCFRAPRATRIISAER